MRRVIKRVTWWLAKFPRARRVMCLLYARRVYGTMLSVLRTDWAIAEDWVRHGIDPAAHEVADLGIRVHERDRVPLAFFTLLHDIADQKAGRS